VAETLREKQSRFVHLAGLLIEYAYAHGFEITFGEAYRTPEQAALNAQTGAGIVNSLHTQRLAIDLLLFRDGKYLTDSADYRPLGEYWESLAPDCAWGGRFNRPDGNHFSIRHGGRA
jgi:hypothetical protein